MQFLDILADLKESDSRLSVMLSIASDYAEIYLLTKQRQKGCDGMGELSTVKEELIGVIEEVMEYCRKENHITDVMEYDIDLIADKIRRLSSDGADLIHKQ
ncbi:MAG: hypothetical protein AB1499_00015 [Nitrospirota bacterium]